MNKIGSISENELAYALIDVSNSRDSDIVVVHSFLGAFTRFENGLHTIVETLQKSLGPSGTLVMPAYTTSFLRGNVYDHSNSPSEVGVLTEYFRQQPDVSRTFDPVYSHAIWGSKREQYSEIYTRDILGMESLFAQMHKDNALLILLGTSMNRGGTFLHHFERTAKVPYRFLKTFRGTAIKDHDLLDVEVDHYARYIESPVGLNFDRLERDLIRKDIAKVTYLRRGRILGVRLKYLYNEACVAYQKDPYYLVRLP